MLDLTMKGINNVKIFNFLIGEVMRGHNYRLKIFEGAGPHEEEKIIMFIFPFLSLAFLFGLTDF